MAEEFEPYRLLQVFLSTRGSFEVSVLAEGGAPSFRCTCPGFATRSRCRHVSYVKKQWAAEDGYVVNTDSAKVLPTAEELSDPQTWRMFVLEHAPVIVLPVGGR